MIRLRPIGVFELAQVAQNVLSLAKRLVLYSFTRGSRKIKENKRQYFICYILLKLIDITENVMLTNKKSFHMFLMLISGKEWVKK